MADELQGKKIAFIATEGVEQVELTEPWKAVALPLSYRRVHQG